MDNPIKIRTIFMGTSPFAKSILLSLLENKYNVISVYTKPDKKIDRGNKLQKSPVKILAEENKVEIFQPEKFDEDTIKKIKEQKPDLIIVAAYGKILPKSILSIPGFGCINVHPSLLPKFRGPSPIQNTLLEGEEKTGTTIMLMDETMDTGDILAQKTASISSDETYENLHEKLSDLSAKLLIETVPIWIRRKISPKKQNGEEATYCQLIERKDGQIIWDASALSIYNRFRAFSSWPGVFTFWEKDGYNLRLKIHKLSLSPKRISEDHREFGQVFDLDGNIAVQTSDGAILLEEVQLEGKNKNLITDFVNGHPDFIGSVLK